MADIDNILEDGKRKALEQQPCEDVIHRDRTVQDFVDKCRECGRKKVLDKISEEVDDLRNYSYLVPDMIFDEVQRVIDKYKE